MEFHKNPKSTKNSSFLVSMVLIVLAIGLQKAEAIQLPQLKSLCGATISANPEDCEYGHYEVIFESRKCQPRKYCYIGPYKRCRADDVTTRCLENYECYCGTCQRELKICPQQNYMKQMWRKRVQNNLMEYLME